MHIILTSLLTLAVRWPFALALFLVRFAQEPRDDRNGPHWADRLCSGDRRRAAHAKLVSDGLASEIGSNINKLLASGYAVQAGHRERALFLAQVHSTPAVDAGNKMGMWSTSRSIVAYF